MKTLNYLITNKLKNLIESVGDFHRPWVKKFQIYYN
jgi:hypothetical protein